MPLGQLGDYQNPLLSFFLLASLLLPATSVAISWITRRRAPRVKLGIALGFYALVYGTCFMPSQPSKGWIVFTFATLGVGPFLGLAMLLLGRSRTADVKRRGFDVISIEPPEPKD